MEMEISMMFLQVREHQGPPAIPQRSGQIPPHSPGRTQSADTLISALGDHGFLLPKDPGRGLCYGSPRALIHLPRGPSGQTGIAGTLVGHICPCLSPRGSSLPRPWTSELDPAQSLSMTPNQCPNVTNR